MLVALQPEKPQGVPESQVMDLPVCKRHNNKVLLMATSLRQVLYIKRFKESN